jgi:hypothetical protein
MNTDNSEWSSIWPVEPGLYLVYGGHGKLSDQRFRADFHICKVRTSGNQHALYICGGMFIFPSEFTGVFRKFTEEAPKLPGQDK